MPEFSMVFTRCVNSETWKVRFCVDSRKLNSVTVKDAYPIPNIDGIISRLPPVFCISKIDLKDAFWQIKLEESK